MPLRFILLAVIIAVNAFFAAAEVSLVAVRRSRLKELAARNSAPARAALGLLANPERLLSLTQIGVTLTSLGLGWAGEDTAYRALAGALGPVTTPLNAVYLHGASFAIAFLIISYFHVVLGEVAPKNLAIAKADRLALLVAPVLLIFYRLAVPFVYVVERSVRGISRALGLHGLAGGGHSTEELKLILESSRSEGHLEGFEEVAIQKLLELQDVSTREIMTPRIEIVSAPVDASLDHLLRMAIEHKYSRLPVYEEKPEHVIGIVHFKDLLRAWQERKTANDRRVPSPPFRLRRYLREPMVVPETKPLNQLVDEFRAHHAHMAMVVDEFGMVTGLVTLEDALEQVFGEIGDEHDVRRPKPVAGAPVIEVEGGANIRDLASEYGIELPGDAGFETLAGFLLLRLGYIPAPGDSVTYGPRTFIVQQMDRNRIARVKIVTARPAEEQAVGEPGKRRQ
jgi:CBS domain containing-hemolysin-like protein